MSYYLYILYSSIIDRYYIGHTSNLDQRIRKHNTNHKGFTGKSNDWTLVFSEVYSSKRLAFERERQIKAWKNRKRIIQLIDKGSEHASNPVTPTLKNNYILTSHSYNFPSSAKE